MKKRILSLAAMLICLVAAWAEDFIVDDISYNITSTNDLTVEVTSGGEYSGEIVIPPTVQYNGETYSVTSIGNEAFAGCSELTSITIPSTVTSIGKHYFWQKVSSNSRVGVPSNNPFLGCSSLASIIVESGNTVYDSRDNCNAIIITNTNKLIAGCQNTVIPNTLTSIESLAFVNCSGLTSVTIPSSVTSIADDAFLDCSGLTSIVVEEGNTVYNSRNDCNAIIKTSDNTLIVGCRNTVIPSSVTSIGNNAFYGCSGLTSVTIPNSVTSIGFYAFYGCI